MRVVVAMSGGVDSSAAAVLLHEQGHEVIGVSLRLSKSETGRAPGRCCSPDDLDDARAVADKLGIPFYVFEATDLFSRTVVDPFVGSYLAGETPIPCLACNREVKFGHLLARAEGLGAQLATGHYARIETDPDGRRRLRRGVDESRDQSYFLYELGQRELARLVFPVGHLTKAESREVARRAGLLTADKPESQDICFVPDGDAAGFVARAAGGAPAPGRIVTRSGEVVGEHAGLHAYTVGQRKGLPASTRIGGGDAGHKLPIYVSEIRADRNEIVVGPAAEIERTSFSVRGASWVSGSPPAGDEVLTVRVRHRHGGTPCTVRAEGDGFTVHALEPVRAPAPGQAAVVYRGDEVVGGGTISRT